MGSELKYGFIAGIAIILWTAFQFYMGWNYSGGVEWAGYVSFFILATGAYLSVVEKRKLTAPPFKFKHAFVTALITCFIISIMKGIFAYLYVSSINPDFVMQSVEHHFDLIKDKIKTDEIEKTKENLKAFYSAKGQFMDGIGTTMVYGLFISLVIGVFTRTRQTDLAKAE